MKKKFIALMLSLLLAAGLFGCSNKPSGEGGEESLRIVCTIFPQYDWVRQIMGDLAGNAELTLLLDSGVDLHSYQPTAEDILKVSDCDLFIYVGGESDAWVEDALAESGNPDRIALNLMEALGEAVKEEEIVEGMEAEEHEHEDEEHEGEEHEGEEHEDEEHEFDEHVWLSLKNAKLCCAAIADALSSLDADNADAYRANDEAYAAELDALDGEYASAVGQASLKTVLFGDRFPFRYLVDDYALTYYAAFVGCSAETEASFETVVFLANKMDELQLPAVLVIEGSDQKLAGAILENTANPERPVLVMDSLQSVTGEQAAGGKTYLAVMQSNLEVLREALG